MKEEWRDTKFGDYMASSLGTIQHREIYGPIKHKINAQGYVEVFLHVGNALYRPLAHRFICETFHANKQKYKRPHVNHKNGIKHDNSPGNLEWCSPAENARHAASYGLMKGGSRNTKAVITLEMAIQIKALCMLGMNRSSIARLFNISRNAADNIHYAKSWRKKIRIETQNWLKIQSELPK